MSAFWDGCWWVIKCLAAIWVLLCVVALVISMIKTIAEKIDPPKEKAIKRYREPPEFMKMSCALMLSPGNGTIVYSDEEKILYINDVYVNCENPDILTIHVTHMSNNENGDGVIEGAREKTI